MYVLDEPSTGLHPADNEKLLDSLKRLRDAGNSVIVVEHDEDTIRSADYLIDMGPGSGESGGEVIASGSLKEILKDPSRSPELTSVTRKPRFSGTAHGGSAKSS